MTLKQIYLSKIYDYSKERKEYLINHKNQKITNPLLISDSCLRKFLSGDIRVMIFGQETIGLFKHYAKVYMEEIMEEYLPLIYSSSIEYDPLINVDYTETFTRTANVGNTGSSSSNSSSTAIASDTPQGRVSRQQILAGDYATSTTGSEIDNTTTTSSGSNSAESYTKRQVGNSGVSATAQKMIEQYRDNIRAINREIIEKLEPLFMGLY